MRSTRCDDIIQARGVLKSLIAKVVSDAAEKKHKEFRDVQKSEMVRLRDETHLVLETNGRRGSKLGACRPGHSRPLAEDGFNAHH